MYYLSSWIITATKTDFYAKQYLCELSQATNIHDFINVYDNAQY